MAAEWRIIRLKQKNDSADDILIQNTLSAQDDDGFDLQFMTAISDSLLLMVFKKKL